MISPEKTFMSTSLRTDEQSNHFHHSSHQNKSNQSQPDKPNSTPRHQPNAAPPLSLSTRSMDQPKPDPNAPPPPSPPGFYYTPLPPQPPDQHYVALPFYYPRRRRCCTLASALLSISSLVLFAALAYVLWPSDPRLKIVRLWPTRIRIRTVPVLAVDISMLATIRVRNADAYWMDYGRLDVAVGYRGRMLGRVRSGGGHVRAFGSSYVDAALELNGVELLAEAAFLMEDLAKGRVPFDTLTEVEGHLGLWFFRFPLKAQVSCEVLVNTKNQTIVRQSCYPERLGSSMA
ncbi:hypothetical protein BT93_E0447 [Corymbia citriodora subsp. variegata]|nr:hypothetical protein BT93_E0447 [Corymbia citriodora subsp. variegata]